MSEQYGVKSVVTLALGLGVIQEISSQVFHTIWGAL